jgi:hypothetical protein
MSAWRTLQRASTAWMPFFSAQVGHERAETGLTMARNTLPTRPLGSTALVLAVLLSGCEYLGIESAAQVNEQKSAEGKAVGGACRHAKRAIEDCYRLNPKANKAAIYDGWKEMDAYMRENNIESITPVIPPDPPKKPAKKEDPEATEAAADAKEAPKKAAAKH